MRERNTDKSDAAGAVQELVCTDGARSEENQGEGAQEFGGEFCVLVYMPNPPAGRDTRRTRERF
jgi:hypothetical protein